MKRVGITLYILLAMCIGFGAAHLFIIDEMLITTNQLKEQAGFKTNGIQNKTIKDEINYKQTTKIMYEPIVCLIEKDDAHREAVQSIVEQFDKPIIYSFLDTNEAFTKGTPTYKKLLTCDVISNAVALDGFTQDHSLLDTRINFLQEFKGIVVASGGNNPTLNTNQSQEFAKIKELHPELAHKILIVSTATIKNGKVAYANTSIGDTLDVVVPTDGILITYKGMTYHSKGTSTATPAIVGIISNYLREKGKMEARDIKEAILSTNNKLVVNGYSFPIVDAEAMKKYKTN
jgi:hypothetical protein